MTYAQKIAAQAGLVRTFSFQASDLTGTYGDDFGSFMNADQINPIMPVLDTSVLASGQNSIKFTIPSQSSSGASGQWFTNFSSNRLTLFGAGETFWIQFQQKFDRSFFETLYTGGGGWKQSMIGTGDPTDCSSSVSGTCQGSCSTLEIVLQNTNQRGFPQMYNSCGIFAGFEEPYGVSDYKLQNGMPSPFCLYSTSGSGYPGCSKYSDGLLTPSYQVTQWGTFTIQVTLGADSGGHFQNSHVNTWVSWGGAAAVQLFNYDVNLVSSGTEKYGKLWLLPYHTGKDAAQVHTQTYVWYANPIIATQAIPLTTDEIAADYTLLVTN